MTNTESEARWCKAIEVRTEKVTVKLRDGAPEEMPVVTLKMHAMNLGKSLVETNFAAQADEELTFMIPAAILPLLLKHLLRVQEIISA